ncbi:hypothetical protein [Frigidibacter oleivorans]|uniref:hypothetical protein n=1 Tax=Frigidibacter oleivorans TaxID=2487129 RepID=UPI000F8E3E80|nr:hypothetical protein [Frigidibacter oleivorans]
MRLARALTLALTTSLTLAACGRVADSRVNPFNWFGRAESRTVVVAADPAALPPGTRLVDQVTALDVNRTRDGAIVTATGIPPTQGWWDATLLPRTAGAAGTAVPVDGVVTLRFVVTPPPGPTRQSTPQSRQLTAGLFLSNGDLEGVSRIVVEGAQNAMTSSR